MTITTIKTEKEITNLGSAYTITGAGGDLNEWVEGYNKLLKDGGIGTPEKWYTFKGKDMNNAFGLTGNNRYKDDITFLSFSLDGLNIGKLAMFKLQMQDRWLDDIINNNLMRENIDEEEE